MKLKYKLNSKNKFTEIGALAVPVLRCAFGLFNWRFKGIKKSTKRLESVWNASPKNVFTYAVCKKGKEEEEVVVEEEEACYK